MKKFIALAAVTTGVLLSSACSNKVTREGTTTTSSNGGSSTAPAGAEAKAADRALVRFINATGDPKDLYFGDMKAFSGTAPGSTTAYVEMPTERHDFKLFGAGAPAGDPLASNSEGLTGGKHYTVVAMNKDNGKQTLDAVADDFVRPEVGRAKVRVVNAAPGAGDVDIYQGNTTTALLSGVGVDHISNYKEVDPTVAELAVRRGGSKKDELKIKDLNLMPDRFYTIVVMGDKGGPLKSQVIQDQFNDQTAVVPRG